MGFYDWVIIGATTLMCIILKLGSKKDVKTDSAESNSGDSVSGKKESKSKTNRKNK